tara:strand:+ start:1120 stop:1386 length:267 start_codon:yes stop_codon:yes gene_type:complete
MQFHCDMLYNDKVVYTRGTVYEVPNSMVDRWLKRGGEIIDLPKGLEAKVEQKIEVVETSAKMSEDKSEVKIQTKKKNTQLRTKALKKS